MLPIASNAVDLILVDPSAAEPPSGCAVADAASIGIRRTVVRISGPGGNATAGQLELVPSLCHPPQTAPRHTYVRQHLYAWVFSTVPDASCLLSLSAALGFRRASGHASFAPEAAGAFTLEDPQELADASCFCDSR